MGDVERRRRRHRHHGDAPPTEGPSAATPGVHDGGEPPRHRRGGHGEDGERGLRGLVGPGSSQVGVTAAMRARDASHPTEEDLAEAEARVQVVRRNWTPREDLPRR
ncbi:hypothetical protein [Micromonospora endolithica]|uniref:Uncharacterized protein n=1 Tax=Micromonospora endolithica TaxID=230091 RepID=A0A3A9Z194_9ACTN|nr:hypothetical protein [Micromonospora endolithica]RKN42141.1 hypothetical protein D7223_23720 [Micromonospora endolithica]TWJ19974.1 hypothetical protein JD76_00060 [Micromonospora endolithica]